jgi:integrase/recombinase XerD
MRTAPCFASLLQAFFTDRLMDQCNASPHTIASYRDTFKLLLGYAKRRLGKSPSALSLEHLDCDFIGEFLLHLEEERGNSPRSRNARLAAIHSFFRYVTYQVPEHSALVQQILAIPRKKYERIQVEYLTEEECHALLDSPDRMTWAGRRDYALLLVAIQTGLRVSELTGLRCGDVSLGTGPHVRCTGKGRKSRCTPLRPQIADTLKAWMEERNADAAEPLFPNRCGSILSRDGVQFIITKHTTPAALQCTSLKEKRVTPHVLRHTAAMNLLHAGADTATIALWLGHETLDTVHVYVEADLAAKQRILEKTSTLGVRAKRFRPTDPLLTFLKEL